MMALLLGLRETTARETWPTIRSLIGALLLCLLAIPAQAKDCITSAPIQLVTAPTWNASGIPVFPLRQCSVSVQQSSKLAEQNQNQHDNDYEG
jgi:hypothetical protein